MLTSKLVALVTIATERHAAAVHEKPVCIQKRKKTGPQKRCHCPWDTRDTLRKRVQKRPSLSRNRPECQRCAQQISTLHCVHIVPGVRGWLTMDKARTGYSAALPWLNVRSSSSNSSMNFPAPASSRRVFAKGANGKPRHFLTKARSFDRSLGTDPVGALRTRWWGRTFVFFFPFGERFFFFLWLRPPSRVRRETSRLK